MGHGLAAKYCRRLRTAIRIKSNCDEHVDQYGHLGCEPADHLDKALTPFFRDCIISIDADMGERIGSGSVALFSDGSVGVYIDDGSFDEYTRTLNGADRRRALRAIAADWHMDYLSAHDREFVRSLV